MTHIIKEHLLGAQTRMKKQANKHRSERSFEVGTWVYMKLQPYLQSSVIPRANQKLSFKYFGPFEIVEKVGKVAYRLKLLESSSIYPVVHVSQLKLSAGFKGPVTFALPSDYS
jgi:hypothetical protein